MTTITIGEAMHQPDKPRINHVAEQHVYIYRNEDTVFYVGRSTHPMERLCEHLGMTKMHPYSDAIGQIILDNAPDSMGWIVEYYTLFEIAPDVCKKHTDNHGVLDREFAGDIENQLIEILRPCMNATNNRNKTHLPEKYIKRKIANEGVKLD